MIRSGKSKRQPKQIPMQKRIQTEMTEDSEEEVWEVDVREFLGVGLEVYARKGCLTNEDTNAYECSVMPPNCLERLLGVTLKSKTEKRILECRKWCEQQNKKEALSATTIKKLRENWCNSCLKEERND